MLVKVDSNLMAALGATGAADFNEKLTAFVANAEKSSKFMAESQVTLETLQASIKDLEGKISGLATEARVKEIVGSETATAMTTWAGSEAGKKIIGAESSRIALEALGAVGTTPAKPSPIPAAGNETPEQKSAALIAEGKFEDAWKADKGLQAEFIGGPKSYAAFMRANSRGSVQINTPKVNRN